MAEARKAEAVRAEVLKVDARKVDENPKICESDQAQSEERLQRIVEIYLSHLDTSTTYLLLKKFDHSSTPEISNDTAVAFCCTLIDNLNGYEPQVRSGAKFGLIDLMIELDITDIEVDFDLFEHLF